jgi:HEPN domain-containing protein
MPPTTSRDFLRVAAQQLMTAETLLRQTLTLAAQYVGGYTVECSLKALILERTPDPERAEKLKKLTAGAKMHRPDVLLEELRDLGVALPLELAKRMRRFDWTTDLRYEIGRRDTGETVAFLNTARLVYKWAKDQLP